MREELDNRVPPVPPSCLQVPRHFLQAMPLLSLGYIDVFFHLLHTMFPILLPFPPQQPVSAPALATCIGPSLTAKPAEILAPCINKTSCLFPGVSVT